MLTHSARIDKALVKAMQLHAAQRRKHDGETPFIVHPIGVAMVLSQFTQDEALIAAALLHDTVEDTDYTGEQLRADFGDEIADIVLEVTEPPRKEATWEERKEAYLQRIATNSREARMITCGDKINNLASMITAFEEQGESMWGKFNERSFWFYGRVLEALRKHNDLGPLLDLFATTLQRAEKTFQRKAL
ncbi:phosphohydrolase [Candidatus Peregrinibacteria bacterium CG11_big_fil_rev_8_21_14_0_20_46_8]|nr:MAG: phosphohydrolase [Candidatus Peregrinibacteria bacterium CG11_big_fil_rev_8_21_14_0_20_46_8]